MEAIEIIDAFSIYRAKFKKKAPEIKICPKCGGNLLKRYESSWNPIRQDFYNAGIFNYYNEIIPGDYTCECGRHFRIEFNECKNRFEIL